MKVAVIIKPDNGCDFYRCLLPCNYMPWQQQDKVKLFYPDHINIEEHHKQYAGNTNEIEEFAPDILFMNQGITDRNIEYLEQLKKKGTKIVLDLDDYWELSKSHPVYDAWYKTKSNERVKSFIRLANIVFVSNERLHKKVIELNKNCLIIPNGVPFGEPDYRHEEPIHPIYEDKINFLYAGGSTHFTDVNILKNKFERIGNDKFLREKSIYTLAGFNPLPEKHCEWDKMVSVFKRTNSYQVLNTLPLQKHMSFYDSANVVLVPLVQNEFNSYKTVLKVIEAATRELPCIVSKVLPYSELEGYPGILWDNWLENIKLCIKSSNFVKDSGKELAEKMKQNYDIKVWALSRYQVFCHLQNK